MHGRSGVGFSGINPLTWECLDAWARMTDRTVYPHEAQALMELDAVLRLATAPKAAEQPKAERRRA